MKIKQKIKNISILLIIAIMVSGIGLNYELAYSLFPCADFTESTSVINEDITSDINSEATIEESMVYRLASYITNSDKRNYRNSRLVSILYCENIFSQGTNFYITSLSKNYNIAPFNDVIIHFIQRQDGKK